MFRKDRYPPRMSQRTPVQGRMHTLTKRRQDSVTNKLECYKFFGRRDPTHPRLTSLDSVPNVLNVLQKEIPVRPKIAKGLYDRQFPARLKQRDGPFRSRTTRKAVTFRLVFYDPKAQIPLVNKGLLALTLRRDGFF